MISRLSCALLLLLSFLAPVRAQYLRISQQPVTAVVGTNDDILLNVWTGSNYITSRITAENFALNLTNITQAITTNLVRDIVDAGYLEGIIDESYVTGIVSEDYVLGIVSTNYLRSVIDTNYVREIADTNYLRSVIDTNYVREIADTNWVKEIADTNYLRSVIDTNWIRSVADSNYVQTIAQAVVATNYFASAETPIASGVVLDTAHGLGGLPTLVRVVLRCKSTDLGYSVGDEVPMGSADAFTYGANSTNVFVIASTTGISLQPRASGTGALISNAKWRFVVYARR